MRFAFTILLIAALAAITECFLPWWSLAAVAFAVPFFLRLQPGKAFLAGFCAIFLLWMTWALCRDIPNDHLLADRLALLILKTPNHLLFIGLSAFIGGLTGGMAAWSGALLRKTT